MSTPTIDNNALTASLGALKLGGMMQTLDARLAQARAGELGHLEFPQVLCHDEISRRETTAIARRTRRARFEETLTLEGFNFAAAPKLPAAQIRDLAALASGRRVGDPLRPGRSRENPHRPRPRAPRDPRRRRGPIHQNQPRAGRTRRRTRRWHLGPLPARTRPTRRPGPR